jgi:hypothetical protein
MKANNDFDSRSEAKAGTAFRRGDHVRELSDGRLATVRRVRITSEAGVIFIVLVEVEYEDSPGSVTIAGQHLFELQAMELAEFNLHGV